MTTNLEKRSRADAALHVERELMNASLSRLEVSAKAKVKAQTLGRVVFGLDLTGSRRHSLSQSRIAIASMFTSMRAIGRIEVKLAYYRGQDECRQSQWFPDALAVTTSMMKLDCEGGNTQIERLLTNILENRDQISCVVFLGDHFEEDADRVLRIVKGLGQKRIPVFIFHECADHDEYSLAAKPIFRKVAETSGGVYAEFAHDSAAVIREMLLSVAAFSTGGREAVKMLPAPATKEARELHERLLLGASG